MRKRSLWLYPVLWVGLVGLAAGVVWLFAIADFSSLYLIPVLLGLFLLIIFLDRLYFSKAEPTRPASRLETDPQSTVQVNQPNPPSELATFKEQYRLLDVLASGKFGKTYVAEDLTIRPKRLWVIKHFIPQPNSGRELQTTQRLFKGEASVLEKLKDLEAIPKLLNYFENESEIWFIREYIVGHSLQDELVVGHPVSEAQLIEILTGILQSLDAIHPFRIIHRDIKPSNIIRRKTDRRLILIDFGAAKEWNPQEKLMPMMTVAVGTASYTSYEQMMGQPVPSSDIYSTGVIGIQAITGLEPNRLPLAQTGEYRWRDHAKLNPKLADILDKMTRTSVNRRYQFAADVLADLSTL